MFATLRRNSSAAEIFHITTFSNITKRYIPLYLVNNSTGDATDIKILEQHLTNHVNDMWKKYLQ